MMKIGQIYFKNLALWTLQDFLSMFDYFSSLFMKGLTLFTPILYRSFDKSIQKNRNVSMK